MDETRINAIAETLAPALAPVEERRARVARSNQYVYMGGVLAALPLIFLAVLNASVPFAIGAAIIAAIGFGISQWRAHGVKKDARQLFLSEISRAMDVVHEDVPGWSDAALFQRHHLLGNWDRQRFSDGLVGRYHEMDWKLFHAHLERRSTDNKGRTRYTTVFNGILIKVDLTRAHDTDVLILRDQGWFNGLRGLGGDWKRAGLGEGRFERAFEVYTKDQVEARVLLTPPVMEGLLDLEEAWHGKKLRAAFVGQQLLIAVGSGRILQMKDFDRSFMDSSRITDFVREIRSIEELIDVLAEPIQMRVDREMTMPAINTGTEQTS